MPLQATQISESFNFCIAYIVSILIEKLSLQTGLSCHQNDPIIIILSLYSYNIIIIIIITEKWLHKVESNIILCKYSICTVGALGMCIIMYGISCIIRLNQTNVCKCSI